MNISLILAHPNEQSFNHAIAAQALNTLKELDHQVFYHDLYREQFDPILPYEEFDESAQLPSTIQVYCDELRQSDGIIIVHPNWLGQPPAILKGGIKFFHRDMFQVTVTSTLEQRKMWLRHVEQVITRYVGQIGNLS